METIETAPKKRKLLLFVHGKGWVQGRFRDRLQIDNKKWTHECFIDDNLFVIKPTHWMELPEEPKGEL